MHSALKYFSVFGLVFFTLTACGVKGQLERPEQAVATPKVDSTDIPPPPGAGREQPDVSPESQVEKMRQWDKPRGASW